VIVPIDASPPYRRAIGLPSQSLATARRRDRTDARERFHTSQRFEDV